MDTFYWLINEVLAGCSRPGGSRRGPPSRDTLHDDLETLRARGIASLLTLTEDPLPEESTRDFEVLHLPVEDMTAPQPAQFLQALSFIDRQRALDRSVAVHCLVGQGRTATILAAYLIRAGTDPADAITRLRALCPGAIGSESQVAALHAFGDRRDWIL